MRKISKKIFILLIFLLFTGICFAMDPAEGFWLSIDEKTGKPIAGWEIFIYEGKLYGRIVSLTGLEQNMRADRCKNSYKGFPTPGKVSEMPVIGTTWIFGLVPVEGRPGQWKSGNVVDPNDGSMYECKITLHPADGKKFKIETLEMRGITIGPFGRSQFWQRATRIEATSLR